MDSKTIFTSDDQTFRIVEHVDLDADIDDLKGDCFDPRHMAAMYDSDMTAERLAEDEKLFEEKVSEEGVFGYELQKWNPAPGVGWEHVDSCWGFIGAYDFEHNAHYIVNEMQSKIPGFVRQTVGMLEGAK
jgi:hypothetical protein